MENCGLGICRNRERHDLRLQCSYALGLVWAKHSKLFFMGSNLQHVFGARRLIKNTRPCKTKGTQMKYIIKLISNLYIITAQKFKLSMTVLIILINLDRWTP